MNITSKVRIGIMDYKVIVSGEKLILDAQQCKGIIDYDNHTIKLDENIQDKQGQEQTFLHEIIHGIVRERNFKIEGDEELVVDEMARGLHQIIRDNPEIFK